MELKGKVWIDGSIVELKDANVSILTHALHYGTGCFEGIHSYKTERGPAIFRLKEHLERFFESAKALGMRLDFSKEQVREGLLKYGYPEKVIDSVLSETKNA